MIQLLSVDGYKGTTAAPSPQSGLINGQVQLSLDDIGSTKCEVARNLGRLQLLRTLHHRQLYNLDAARICSRA